ncbi:MAG: hypothetical protein H7Z19_18530 [Chitinophagaceae bacterium]|nr:hypothetical protein [Rubrivivax sp.]
MSGTASARETSPKQAAEDVYLDLARWPRREAYHFFRGFNQPFFGLCTRVDAAPLKAAVTSLGRPASLSLAYHFIALRLANQLEPMRYRLEGDRVRVHPVVHGGATVLRDDDSFGFAYIDHHDDFAAFCAQAAPAVESCRTGSVPFDPRPGDTAIIHFTTLPWVHFTSFSHARQVGLADSVPKIAFGRIDAEATPAGGRRLWLPLSVEVHHGLMDGLHAGRFVQAFEAALAQPAPWLAGAA